MPSPNSMQSSVLHGKIFRLSFFLTVFVVLVSPMPFAFSSPTPTVESINIKAQNVLDKVQNLLDGEKSLYKISTSTETTTYTTVGLYADCSSIPADTDCIFTVDSIRLTQKSDSIGKIGAICIDNEDFSNVPTGLVVKQDAGCSPLNLVAGEVFKIDPFHLVADLQFQGALPIKECGKECKISIYGMVDFPGDIETIAIQRQPLAVPLPESIGLGFGDKKAGGNVLTDAGFGVLSTKFVVLDVLDAGGDIEFIGTVPDGIRLILGKFPTNVLEPTCNDSTGDTTCPTDFSNILKHRDFGRLFSVDHRPTSSETTFTFVDFNPNKNNPFDSKITKIGLVTDIQTQTVIDTVNDLIAQGDLSQRTGRSILWLLNAAKTLEESGDKETAISKLNAATQRVNQLAQRNQLTPSSAQSILGSIQDAINNIENPPVDDEPPFIGSTPKKDLAQLNILSERVRDEFIDIDKAIDSFQILEEKGLFDKLFDVTVKAAELLPALILRIGEEFTEDEDVRAAIGDIKMKIDTAEGVVDDALGSLDEIPPPSVITDVKNAFKLSTPDCPAGSDKVGEGPAALCTTESSCPDGSGTAPNGLGTECVIRTSTGDPPCPAGSTDNGFNECGPVIQTSSCPDEFIEIDAVCGKEIIPAVSDTCPDGFPHNGVECAGGDPECDDGFDFIGTTCVHDHCHNKNEFTGLCIEPHFDTSNASCPHSYRATADNKCAGAPFGGSAKRCPSETSFNFFETACLLKAPCPSDSVEILGECGPVITTTCPNGFIKKSEFTCGVADNPSCPTDFDNVAGTCTKPAV